MNIIWRVAVLVGFLCLGSGCDDGGSGGSARNLSKRHFTFDESSAGLPDAGKWRETIDIYDLNGDGNLDILAPSPRLPLEEAARAPHVWYGDGKGVWTKERIDVPADMSCSYGAICGGDFNGDGIPDIALAMHNLGLSVLVGDGKGSYTDLSEGLISEKQFTSRALVCADFNKDGVTDLASVPELSPRRGRGLPVDGCLWICSRSKETWRCHPVGQKKTQGYGGLIADKLAVGDVNGDGYMDIGVASLNHEKDLIVWLGDGKGGFASFNKGLTEKVHYQSVAFADVNKDGRDDLIASVTGLGTKGIRAIKVFLSQDQGFTEMSEGLPDKAVFFAVEACDLNGDGTVEIIGGTAEGGLRLFSQNGSEWEEVEVSGLPQKGLQRIYGIYCKDLNMDGYRDIVVNYALGGNNNDGGIRVFLGVLEKEK